MPIKLLQLYKEPRKIYKTTKPYLDGIPLEHHEQYWSDLYNEPKTYMAIDRWDMMGDWSDREMDWREFEKIWVEDIIKEIQYAEEHTGISLRNIESHKSIMRSEWHGTKLSDIYFAFNRYREKVLDITLQKINFRFQSNFTLLLILSQNINHQKLFHYDSLEPLPPF